MALGGFARDLFKADALDGGRRAREILLHEALAEADGVEDLRAAIGLIGGDAHLGHDLQQALVHRLDEALHRLVFIDLLGEFLGHAGKGLEGEIGIDGFRAIARQTGEVMDFARLAGLHHEAHGGAQTLADEVVMHGRRREDRGDRHAVGADHAVGEDDDVVAAAHRLFGALAQTLQHGLHARCAKLRRIGHVEGAGVEGILQMPDAADLFEVRVGQDRLAHFQTLALGVALAVEDVGARADEGHEAHDELLADRIDRRVGHLREVLLEIAVEQLRLVGEDGDGRIRAHGAHALLARHRHGREQDREVFLRVAEGLLAVEQGDVRAGRAGLHGLQVFQNDLRALQPVAVGMGVGEGLLHLVVGDDAVLLQIHQQHLAWLQAPLLDDGFLGDRQHADFRGHDHEAILGHDIAGGAQAVAVQGRADLAAVGEGHGGGAVPRLHEGGVIFVEGAAILIHERIARPGFGDQHHHGVAERVAALHEEFQRIVEAGGVRLSLIGNGPELGDIIAEELARHGGLTGRHPVDVAAQGVDLAVMGDHAIGMGETPGGEGVGGETLMDQREGADEARVAQVLVIGAELAHQNHALVDDGAAGHGDRIEFRHVAAGQRIDGVGDALAGEIELTLEVILVLRSSAIGHENLTHHGLDGLHGLAKVRIVHGDVAPADQGQAFLRELRGDDLFRLGAGRVVAGHEELTDAIVLGGWQGHAQARAFLHEEVMGDLDEDAAAVAELGIRAHRAAMVEIEQDLQALLNDCVGLAVVHVGDEADAAGILAMGGIKKALSFGHGGVDHGDRHGGRSKCGGSQGFGGVRAFERAAHRLRVHAIQSPVVVPVHCPLRSVMPPSYASPPHTLSRSGIPSGPPQRSSRTAKSKLFVILGARSTNGQQSCPI